MNVPRQLFASLLQFTSDVTVSIRLYINLLYQDLFGVIWQTYLLIMNETMVIMNEVGLAAEDGLSTVFLVSGDVIQELSQSFIPVINDAVMITASVTNLATLIVAYWIYLWTDVVIQSVQTTLTWSPSAMSDVDVSGGIVFWIVVLFALATYGFVYRYYPNHEDWVSTVLSVLAPALYKLFWQSE